MAVRLPSGQVGMRGLRACTLGFLLAGGACAQVRGRQHTPLPEAVRDLPLEILPVSSASPVLALVMSGDGNWAPFIADLADALAARGIPVVGLESRAYLSRPRTPDEVTADMERALRTYLREWGAHRILIVGYSRGADFAPFLVNRLSPDLRARVVGVGLFSPTKMASFEFHLIDLVRYKHRDSDLGTLPEVEALAPLRVLCVYGIDDADTLCPLLPAGMATVVARDAGHRLHQPEELAKMLLEATVDATPAARSPFTAPAPAFARGGRPGSR
jgi:type IV secretory pathway VirJ component